MKYGDEEISAEERCAKEKAEEVVKKRYENLLKGMEDDINNNEYISMEEKIESLSVISKVKIFIEYYKEILIFYKCLKDKMSLDERPEKEFSALCECTLKDQMLSKFRNIMNGEIYYLKNNYHDDDFKKKAIMRMVKAVKYLINNYDELLPIINYVSVLEQQKNKKIQMKNNQTIIGKEPGE